MRQHFENVIDQGIRCLLAALAVLGMVVCTWPWWGGSDQQRQLRRAGRLLAAEQFDQAEHAALAVLHGEPGSAPALLIAAEAAIRLERQEDALRYLHRVADDGSAAAMQAQYRLGERLMVAGRAAEAERCLRRALELAPRHTLALKKLAVLLQVQGRTWESAPLVSRLLVQGQLAKDHLLMVGALDTTYVEDYQFIENCLRSEPGNCQVLLGRARQALAKSRLDEAEPVLRQIVADQPDTIEAQARLGGIYFDQGREREFLDWRRTLPAGGASHPEIWYVQGLWARRNSQPRAAIRCFLEAARLDPNHKGAIFQLSQMLKGTEHAALADRLAVRSQRLAQLHYLLMEVRFGYNTPLAHKLVDILALLDRPLEAIGWCYVLQSWQTGDEAWAHQRGLQLRRQLDDSTAALTLPAGNLAAALDPSKFPLPTWPTAAGATDLFQPATTRDGSVVWTDDAQRAGVDFQYFNGTTADSGLGHILQATGGGIAVIDFDQDAWPDLYFVQSGSFPILPHQMEYRNRLFRNQGNGTFVDVTAASGVGDGGYGQGVAAGDYNNDGFPDLYVANFGQDRLFLNTGTGEFLDVTDTAGVGGDHWTTSCLIADLDRDAAPELYAVHYSLKEETLAMHCQHENQPRTCAPTLLTAEQDQLFHNQGDGKFVDVTARSGIVAPDGKGLAVIAADFEQRGWLDVFVANDTAANFFFRNQTAAAGAALQFKEQGVLNGTAFDEVGNVQACMGLAVVDANGDQRLDLFVTNFYGESNTLYVQDESHQFTDATRRAGLREPSFYLLGFGAQFIDGELDGDADLLVTNGHIDRTFAHGNPDRMPPQYFENLGAGAFQEQSAASLGEYFRGRYYGRTMARLDWNRDGREDVGISHLEAPVALLTNRTPQTGNYLALHLRGVAASRDAVGTIVTIEAGRRAWMQQVIGGGGYFASNHQRLTFGIADCTLVDRLTVRWPTGESQSFTDVAVNQELILVQGGHGRPLPP